MILLLSVQMARISHNHAQTKPFISRIKIDISVFIQVSSCLKHTNFIKYIFENQELRILITLFLKLWLLLRSFYAFFDLYFSTVSV
jgi:hypothetical protein